MYLILKLMMLFVLLNCAVKVTPKSNNSEPAEPQANSLEGLLKPQLSLTGLEPHKYIANISWAAVSGTVSIVLDSQIVFQAQGNYVQRYSFEMSENTQYKIAIYLQTKPGSSQSFLTSHVEGILVKEWRFTSPQDLVISEVIHPHSVQQPCRQIELRRKRIFIPKHTDPGGPFETKGCDLVLDAEELIIDDGLLETFRDSFKAPKDQAGRNGGTITIKAKRAIGHLRVQLRGENGGDGSDGKPFETPASQGVSGKKGESVCVPSANSPVPTHCFCHSKPTDGQPGANGQNGRQGLPGKRGGDSGLLKIEIAEPSPDFFVTVIKEPGKPGAPGAGGPGQEGGPGGFAAPPDNARRCPLTKPGPKGINGIAGPIGEIESPGKEQLECISVGEGFGRCS
jgi:hypothetical protein